MSWLKQAKLGSWRFTNDGASIETPSAVELVGIAVDAAFIVAVTGWGHDHDRERALASGFDAHLTKPADPKLVAALLARVEGFRKRRN